MKRIFKLFILSTFMILLTGCLQTEELKNATIYTTTYPITYLTNELFPYEANINSIYPNGVNIKEYELSNKKIKDYSKANLFVYNGLTEEKKIASDFVDRNNRLNIIDVSQGLQINYSYEELWLNPINYLMLAQNIKNELSEFINSKTILEKLDENYENVKVTISEFEINLKNIAEDSKNKTIIVSKDYFKFLEDYGFEVISLEDTEDLSNDTINKAKNLISEKTNKYIFITESELNNESDIIKDVLTKGGEVKVLNTMTTLTSDQVAQNDNYTTLMRENIESLKDELYD